MRKLKKIYWFLVFCILFLLPLKATAVCPVCTVGVIAGLGLSRWLGVDDTVPGIWIGAIIIAAISWTVKYIRKTRVNFTGMPFVIALIYYGMIVAPLYVKDITGHPLNVLWGIDKLILGIAIGSVFFLIGDSLYGYFKFKNGKTIFPFAKVVLPIAPLIILSAIFYFITR